ncbi:MAG: TonB-dependent receptor plug domain-containing protein [Gammaproteobacteria bacterium]
MLAEQTALYVNVPPQSLAAALDSLAQQAHLQIIYNPDTLGEQSSRAVVGTYTPREALEKLLAGTGLSYTFTAEDTVSVRTDEQSPPKPANEPASKPDGPTVLPEMTVIAKPTDATSLTNPAVEQAREELRRIPGGASVIEAKDYKGGPVLGGQDALRNAPGVYAQSRSGYGDVRLSIRGSGISVPFGSRGLRQLRDGLPLTRADGFNRSFYADYDDAEYVVIYRGANALECGSITLSGAINLVSPTGHSRPGLRARLNGGSDAFVGGNLSYGGVFGEGWDGYAVVSGFRTDGFRDNDEQSKAKFSGNLGYRFGERSEGRFYFEIEEQKLNQPGSLTKAALENDPTQANAGSARANATLDQTPRSYVGYKHGFLLGDDDQLDVGAYWTNADFENPTNFAQFFDTDYGAALRHELNGTLFGARNRFVWGASAAKGEVETDTFGPIRFGNFVAEPNPGQLEDDRSDSTNLEGFAQEQFYLAPGFSVLAGAQYVYAKREIRTEVPTPPTNFPIFFPQDEEETYHGFSTKLGAI